MHKSKLSTFVIDCRTDDINGAASFWAQALGRRLKPADPAFDSYRSFECAPSEPLLMIQRVDHESRIHLDIETDDIPAEVARLEALGARRLEQIRTWVVMEAPTGQRFCVVRPQRGEFGLHTTTWPSDSAISPASKPALDPIGALAGNYVGATRLWLDPTAAPEESIAELRVEPILGGRWVRFEDRGFALGKPRAGEMLLGFHADASQFEMTWVDSFHTGSAIMWSTGAPREDGVIAVTGSYVAGGERWGWRTEIDPRDGLTFRAFNITPTGEETPAIETRWTR